MNVSIRKSITDRYEETIGWLCLLIAGLTTGLLVAVGFIQWSYWYDLFFTSVCYIGLLTFALIQFVLWLIKRKAQDHMGQGLKK